MIVLKLTVLMIINLHIDMNFATLSDGDVSNSTDVALHCLIYIVALLMLCMCGCDFL